MNDPVPGAPVRRGIQARLAVLVLVAVLGPMILLGWSSLGTVASMRDALLSERRALVAATARYVEREVRGMLEALAATSAQPDSLRAAQVRSRLLSGAMLVDAEGKIVGSDAAVAASYELLRCLDLRAAIRIGNPVVCGPAPGGNSARRFVIVPVRDTTGALYAAVGLIDLTDGAWPALLPSKALPATASIRLEDERGRLLAGEERSKIGDSDVVVSQRLTVLPWTLVVAQPASDAFAAVKALERRWLLLGPSLAAMGAVFAWGVARSVKVPLARLETAAAQIAAGDLMRPLPPLGNDEIGRLGRSFEAMRKALAKDETRRLLLRKVITAQEQERKRIARELHDDTCQMIAAIKLKLVAAGMKDAEAMANRSLDELHRIIYDLRPSVLDDLGLLPAIRWVALRDLAPLGMKVRCELEEPAPKLPFEVEIAVFRAVQEAIHNIIRHAHAETVLVEVIVNAGTLDVVIEDDGGGFDVLDVALPDASGRGLGICGMRERMDLIGGSATVTSSPGKGTRVALSVPLPAEA
jgi:signal transduction histidine kinase